MKTVTNNFIINANFYLCLNAFFNSVLHLRSPRNSAIANSNSNVNATRNSFTNCFSVSPFIPVYFTLFSLYSIVALHYRFVCLPVT